MPSCARTILPWDRRGAQMEGFSVRPVSPGGIWEITMFEVDDRHILVTGGSSGFGRHFARLLAGRGARVTLAARRAEALASAVAEITASGGSAQSVVLDVTRADQIDGVIRQAEA